MSLRYLSMNQLAELTGIDRRTVKKRVEGLKVHPGSGKGHYYDAQEALPRLYATDKSTPIVKQLEEESLRYERARADKLDIEVQTLRGELVPIEEAAKTVEKEYAYVRSQVRAISSKLAKPLSMVTDPAEVKRLIDEAVDETLTELTADKLYEERRAAVNAAGSASSEDEEAVLSSGSEAESSGMGGHVPLPKSRVVERSRKMENSKRRSRKGSDVSGDGPEGKKDYRHGSDSVNEDGTD